MKSASNRRPWPGLVGLAVSACTAALAASPEQNWPQWRGPLHNGVAPAAEPPLTWSETNHVKWKVKIPGGGQSTPIVWDNQIFVQTAIPTGKKVTPGPESGGGERAAADQPGPGSGDGPRGQGPGGPGGGPGGGFGGGFGPGSMLSGRMVLEGDKDKDQRLSREEFSALADEWFDKIDSEKAGKLSQDKFVEGLTNVLGAPPAPPDGGGPGGGGGTRRGGPARFMGPGLFTATDADKDGTLTRQEFKQTFAKWFGEWDATKNGFLDQAKLREGMNGVLPASQFGGGPGGPGGPGGRGGRGFGGGQRPTEVHQFALLCLDRQTGKVLWQQVAREEVPHEAHHPMEGSFAAHSGLTDGERVIAFFGSHGVHCYDLSGKHQWSQDLGKMRIAMSFGEGCSPALYKNTLLVKWDNENGSSVYALDSKTGKTLWKKERDEATSWSTPLILEREGKAQAILSATRKIRSYDVVTGDVLWECGGLTRNVIPCPVADGSTVYCMSGFQGNALLAIRLGGTGDLTGTDAIAWTYKKSTPYVPSPLLYGDKLYFYANNNAVLTCLNTKAGEPLIDAERINGLTGVYASPLGAAGRVYLVGRNGTTVVLKHSDKLEVLATNQLNERFDASPVAAGKELFLRGREYLYCLREP